MIKTPNPIGFFSPQVKGGEYKGSNLGLQIPILFRWGLKSPTATEH